MDNGRGAAIAKLRLDRRNAAQYAACQDYTGFCRCLAGQTSDCGDGWMSRMVDAAIAAYIAPTTVQHADGSPKASVASERFVPKRSLREQPPQLASSEADAAPLQAATPTAAQPSPPTLG
jgi:hypothetical protein